jgi:hypothetical protein
MTSRRALGKSQTPRAWASSHGTLGIPASVCACPFYGGRLILNAKLLARASMIIPTELSAASPGRCVCIALSSFGMDSDLEQSTAAGFSRHLVKPIDIAMLRAALVEMTSGA